MKDKRNSFVALCEHASSNGWCWKIFCGTCQHCYFRISFSKMARGLHPDEESFWPNKKDISPSKEIKEYDDFRHYDRSTTENQIRLASIIAGAEIKDIQKVANFPDWLGYIGLAIYHCPSYKAQKIISKSLLPQFLEIIEKDKKIHAHFLEKEEHNKLLTTEDLEKIEGFIYRDQKKKEHSVMDYPR